MPTGLLRPREDPCKCLPGRGRREPAPGSPQTKRPRTPPPRRRGRRQLRTSGGDGGSGQRLRSSEAAGDAPGPGALCRRRRTRRGRVSHGRPSRCPLPGRETAWRREKAERKQAPLRPEQPESGRPPLRRRTAGCRREEEKLLRDDLSPAVFQRGTPRQASPLFLTGDSHISFLLGSSTGSTRRKARPSEPSTKSEMLRYVR